MKTAPKIGFEEALSRMEKYCAYQERYHKEAEQKLRSFGLKENEILEILTILVNKGFLNEQRFATAFAGGKYRVLKWGRKKIIYQLRIKGINEKIIAEALKEIPDDDYTNTLLKLISKKDKTLKGLGESERSQRLVRFLSSKGYEPEMIFEAIKRYQKK